MPENALIESGSSQDMAIRLNDMKTRLDLMRDFFQSVMEKEVDYGVIPGTQKPTLLKPGAEKLCELYNYAITISEKEEEKDLKTGYYRARIGVRLTSRSNGSVVAEGVGEANTYESRYRYRWVAEKDVPRGLDKEALPFKEKQGNYGPYRLFRLENDDLFSLWNTVLKMAKKRALVDATLSATRSSGLFSQAEDELDAWIEGESDEYPEGDQGQSQQPQSQTRGTQQRPQQPPAGNNTAGNTSRRGPSNPGAPASENQRKAIFGAAKGKGLSSDQVKELVYFQVGKEIDALTMGEASNIIDLINKTETRELKRMASPDLGDDNPPEWLGGGQQ